MPTLRKCRSIRCSPSSAFSSWTRAEPHRGTTTACPIWPECAGWKGRKPCSQNSGAFHRAYHLHDRSCGALIGHWYDFAIITFLLLFNIEGTGHRFQTLSDRGDGGGDILCSYKTGTLTKNQLTWTNLSCLRAMTHKTVFWPQRSPRTLKIEMPLIPLLFQRSRIRTYSKTGKRISSCPLIR